MMEEVQSYLGGGHTSEVHSPQSSYDCPLGGMGDVGVVVSALGGYSITPSSRGDPRCGCPCRGHDKFLTSDCDRLMFLVGVSHDSDCEFLFSVACVGRLTIALGFSFFSSLERMLCYDCIITQSTLYCWLDYHHAGPFPRPPGEANGVHDGRVRYIEDTAVQDRR